MLPTSVPASYHQVHYVTALCDSLNQVTQRCRMLQRDLQDVFLRLPLVGSATPVPRELVRAESLGDGIQPTITLRCQRLRARARSPRQISPLTGDNANTGAEEELRPLQRVWVEVRADPTSAPRGRARRALKAISRLYHFLSLEETNSPIKPKKTAQSSPEATYMGSGKGS